MMARGIALASLALARGWEWRMASAAPFSHAECARIDPSIVCRTPATASSVPAPLNQEQRASSHPRRRTDARRVPMRATGATARRPRPCDAVTTAEDAICSLTAPAHALAATAHTTATTSRVEPATEPAKGSGSGAPGLRAPAPRQELVPRPLYMDC